MQRHLEAMDYLLVIEPRTQGKTSLLSRFSASYAASGTVFGYVDLADLNYDNEQIWFATLWERFAIYFGKESATPHAPTNLAEWRTLLRDLAGWAEEHERKIVLALDEVGGMKRAEWAEPFFVSLRTFFNERAFIPKNQLVTCILAGAFEPKDLIQDEQISPFNIAQRIHIEDFTENEVHRLVSKGEWPPQQVDAIADRIYGWTHGQPYLTQLLCSKLQPTATVEDVDAAVRNIRRDDRSLLPSMLQSIQDDPKLRNYLAKIHNGDSIKYYPSENPRQAQLELLGIIRPDDHGDCVVRNRLYEWILQDEIDM